MKIAFTLHDCVSSHHHDSSTLNKALCFLVKPNVSSQRNSLERYDRHHSSLRYIAVYIG